MVGNWWRNEFILFLMLDSIGQILWFGIFVVPFVITPVYYFNSKGKKLFRIFIGLLISLFICFILYVVSLGILFRDGLGPT